MVIEPLQSSRPAVKINGVPHLINIKEYESFLKQCEAFMSLENNGLEIMTQIICDQIIDNVDPHTTIEEIRPQLKFLKEVGFLLKNLISPIEDGDQG